MYLNLHNIVSWFSPQIQYCVCVITVCNACITVCTIVHVLRCYYVYMVELNAFLTTYHWLCFQADIVADDEGLADVASDLSDDSKTSRTDSSGIGQYMGSVHRGEYTEVGIQM